MTSTDNLVSLKEYVDRRLDAIEANIAETKRDQEIAIEKADRVLSYRLEGMNEFRASLTDQTRNFVTRNENNIQTTSQNAKIEAQSAKIEALQKQQAMWAGGLIVLQAVIVAAVTFFG